MTVAIVPLEKWIVTNSNQVDIPASCNKLDNYKSWLIHTMDEEDFIHTENFVLVDREGRLRGYYDGTSKEEVNQLITDIEVLKLEYGE